MHLLALGAATAAVTAPDPIHLAAMLASFALALARLTDTARPLWNFVPAKYQPFLIALVAVLPDMATGLGLVHSNLDLANTLVAAVGSFFTAMRGALPAPHYDDLSEQAKAELAKVRGTPRRSVPPSSAATICLFIFGSAFFAGLATTQTGCTDKQAATVLDVASKIVTEAVLRSTQASSIVDSVEAKVDAAEKAGLPADIVKKLRAGIAVLRATNQAALAAVQGGANTVVAADSAFAPFRDAWGLLMVDLTSAGLASSGALKAGPGEVAIGTPLALKSFQELTPPAAPVK